MLSANCIDKSELPDFDEETGILPKDNTEEEQDIEIEIVEDEPPFLHGHGRNLHDLSPVCYINIIQQNIRIKFDSYFINDLIYKYLFKKTLVVGCL